MAFLFPRLLRTAAVLGLVVTGSVFAKERPWRKVVTPTFTILTPADDKAAVQWASDFSQFVAGLETIVRIDPKQLPRLTIVLFSRTRDFEPYRPLDENGKAEDVAGFFSRRESWAVAGLAGLDLDTETRRTIFHEGTHWYLSAIELPNPVWLEEGLAEVFSTFAIDKKEVRWGEPIEGHLAVLANADKMPLERLLFLAHGDLFREGDEATMRTGLAYAQSWLFVHYLVFGQREVPKRALVDYVQLLRLKSPDEAFRTAFGHSYAEVERKLDDYLHGGKYYVGKRPPVELPPLKIEAASAEEVEEALGRLALVSGHSSEARRRAEAFVASNSTSARAYELLGQVCEESQDRAGALAAYEKAVAFKSADYRPYFEIAVAKHGGAESVDGMVRGVSDTEGRELADLYERTIELNPRFQAAYDALAGAMSSVSKPSEQDVSALKQGRTLFPKSGVIQVGLAIIDYKNGRCKEAHQELSDLLESSQQQSAGARQYARNIEQAWCQNELITELNDFAQRSEFEKGLAAIEAHANDAGDMNFRMTIAVMKRQFTGARKLQAVNDAMQTGKWREARKLLTEFLDSDAPPMMKAQAQSALSRLDRQGLGKPREPAGE